MHPPPNPPKRCELDKVLRLLSIGKTRAEIRKTLNLKPSTLSNRLRRLENLGCIEKKGKFIINVLSSSHLHPGVTKSQVHIKLNKRGHAFNFKILFPKETDLREKPKIKQLRKDGMFEQLQFGSLKFSKDKNTIWINKESLTIYSNNSYYSNNALHSKFRALKEVDALVLKLKDKFGFTGLYGIEVFREHYGLIYNKFAEWILQRGGKLNVKNVKNKTILWVDDSRKDDKGLREFEGNNPLSINNADSFFESHEKTNWENNAFVVEKNTQDIEEQKGIIGKSMQVLEQYSREISLHLDVEKRIERRLKAMEKREKRLTQAIEKIANNTQPKSI